MKSHVVLAFALLAGSSNAVHATMPQLTDTPQPPTFQACSDWASKQSDDAIDMWGIQEDGSPSSHDKGKSRLLSSCLGDHVPDVVGYGSSVGFNDEFCASHQSLKICSKSASENEEQQATTDTPQTKPMTADQSSNASVYMSIIAVAKLCGEAHVAFSESQVDAMAAFLKNVLKSVSQQEKDKLWGITQQALAEQQLTKKDCFDTLKQSKYVFPPDVMRAGSAQKGPF